MNAHGVVIERNPETKPANFKETHRCGKWRLIHQLLNMHLFGDVNPA